MTLGLHRADHVVYHDTNRIRTVINEVSENVSDSNGNFKARVVKTCWQELSLNGVVYRRFLGETHCLFQRGVLGQPRTVATFMPHGRPPVLTTSPQGMVVHFASPVAQLLSLKSGVAEYRLERLVQLLIATGLADAPDLPDSDSTQKESATRQQDMARDKPALSPRLLSLLASAVDRLINSNTGPEEARRTVPCPVRGDKLLPSAEEQAQLVKSALLQMSDEISNRLIADPSVQQKAATDKPVVVSSPAMPPTQQPPVRHSIADVRSMNTGDHINNQKMTHKPASAAAANKPGGHQQAQAAPTAASVNVNMPVAAQLSILASAVPAAMQSMPIAESGQKQLPPIILPNVGQGAGNRSERKKSKKERDEEEEEERERSRNPFLFDDDEDPLDSDDEE